MWDERFAQRQVHIVDTVQPEIRKIARGIAGLLVAGVAEAA